jgi:hypothetical protein
LAPSTIHDGYNDYICGHKNGTASRFVFFWWLLQHILPLHLSYGNPDASSFFANISADAPNAGAARVPSFGICCPHTEDFSSAPLVRTLPRSKHCRGHTADKPALLSHNPCSCRSDNRLLPSLRQLAAASEGFTKIHESFMLFPGYIVQ